MANTTPNYPSLSNVTHDVTFYMKLQQNLALTLADFPKIAQGRWQYFQLNWDFVKTKYLAAINALKAGPVKVNAKIAYLAFDTLVQGNRTSQQNPLNNQSNIRKFHDLFDQIRVDDLKPTQQEIVIINDEIRRIAELKKSDFYAMRERVRIVHDNLVDSLGMGDDDYNTLFGRANRPQILTFKFSNFQVIAACTALKDTITNLIPTTFVENASPDPFLLVRNALKNPNIPMTSLQNGFMVPFPAGGSLERLAAQYLGDADAWLQIAVANGLQFPYIDEFGVSVLLIINGVGNAIIVPIEQTAYLAINDEVFVGSNGQPLTKRLIQNLEKDTANGHLIVTLTGAEDLASYLTIQGAFLFYYTRNTVNSSKFIVIPTQGSPDFKINAQTPWFVQNLPQDLKGMDVDLALSPDNDILLDTTGDLQVVSGLTNAAQAINLKMNTKTKELIRDPKFGFREIAGALKNNEITQNLLLLIVESALAGDDRFEGVSGLGFAVTGTNVFINASVKIAGSNQSVPLTFQLPKGN